MRASIKFGMGALMAFVLTGFSGDQTEFRPIYRNQSTSGESGSVLLGLINREIWKNISETKFAGYEPDDAIVVEQCRQSGRSSQCYRQLSGLQIRYLVAGKVVTFNPIGNDRATRRSWEMEFGLDRECYFVFNGHLSESECLFSHHWLEIGRVSKTYIDIFECDHSGAYVARYRRRDDLHFYIVTISSIER
jgi:hypothetical protein